MADTKIQKQGRIYISESEYNALRLTGKLKPNTEYCITKVTNKGGTIEGSVVITGDLTVQGKTTTKDIENVSTKSYLITLAEGNTSVLGVPAGIKVPNYNGIQSGALVFDANGVAYVGDVILKNDGNIDVEASDLQPLATRGALVDGNLVKWNQTNLTLVDSGKTVDDFVPKIKNEELNFKCYVERGLIYVFCCRFTAIEYIFIIEILLFDYDMILMV